VTNACGGCGVLPVEVCNGVDDDWDGTTDEGVTNACGGCGGLPADACNGVDDDCDGVTDPGCVAPDPDSNPDPDPDRFHNLDLPLPLRRLCMRAMELSAPSLVISNTLSFGTLGQGPLARDFEVASSDLHARYGFTDCPVIVIGQRDQRLHLRMVYPHSTFDQAGAMHFLATCMQQTLKV